MYLKGINFHENVLHTPNTLMSVGRCLIVSRLFLPGFLDSALDVGVFKSKVKKQLKILHKSHPSKPKLNRLFLSNFLV